VLDVPQELVGDAPGLVDDVLSSARDVTDPSRAAELFAEYFAARFAAAVDPSARQVVLLSGGIDSIVTLAALKQHLRDTSPQTPLEAVTVTGAADGPDVAVAREVAAVLGVPLTVARVTAPDVAALCREVVELLGVDELWEVSAAIVLKTAFAAVGPPPVQVWSGDGGDEVLAGGVLPLTEGPDGVIDGRGIQASDPTEWFAAVQRKVWLTEWTANRLVPDFFERVIPSATLWRSMNTAEACRVGARLHASAVWQEDDKEPLRILAETLGVPRHLTRVPKAAMQQSSGVLDTLLAAARDRVAAIPHAGLYRDTLLEPLELNLIRLWLHTLPPAQSSPARRTTRPRGEQ
jgi:asparagine synthetase B (glutamine-hydrolysing)